MDQITNKPVFFKKLEKPNEHTFVVDDYAEQLRELFFIQNPTLAFQPDKAPKELPDPGSVWIYYPWLNTLVRILPEHEFYLVRTARNRNLITAEEQVKYYNSTIGIGGLSVGSNIAFALALQGGGKHMKLADMDHLALSNTNRIITSVTNLGLPKVVMAARMIYEINPYAEIELFSEGLTEKNIETFFDGLDVMVDELDSFPIKYKIRELCKKYRIPLVQAADNGDNGVVDIERYDLDPQPEFFHGRLGNISYEKFLHMNKFETGEMITRLVDPKNVTKRMLASLAEMGKTIVSWPQLGGAAMLNGAAVAYCVRKIICGEPLESNRALISLDEKLIP